MVFSSVEFLFGFLPITLALYLVVPWIWAKNVILLAASLFFYAWGEPIYVLLMMASIVVNWIFALLIDRAKGRGPSLRRPDADRAPRGAHGEDDGFDSLDVSAADERFIEGDAAAPQKIPPAATVCLVIALVYDLGVLAIFKYLNFALAQLGHVLSGLPSLDIILPIGISFYTLQTVSYLVDVWRGKVVAQRNILYLGMYVAMFPQLIAGPIVRYASIEESVRHRRVTLSGFAQGLRLFVIGLSKKVLLANTCGLLADTLLALPPDSIGFIGCASAIAAYTFQIYFDFGGYSDMAIGLGRMFGFTYPRNFNYPYISKSVTEFWRRWHMTLGSFFRDYVYIPLGGNRVSRPRWMLNLLIVWALTGLWHGAAWNFVAWGLYYGFLLMCEKLFLLRWLDRLPRIVGHLYTIAAFFFGWALFAVTGGLGNLAHWLFALVGGYGLLGTSSLFALMSWAYLSVFVVCAVASTPIVPWVRRRLEAWLQSDACHRAGSLDGAYLDSGDGIPPCELQLPFALTRGKAAVATVISVAVDLGLLALFLCSVAAVSSSGYNPFIYFQF